MKLFPEAPPPNPPLLFGTLADREVDYVALGGLPPQGPAELHGAGPSPEGAVLLARREFDNIERLIAALSELGATILIDPRRPTPIARRSHPASLVSGEHRFDTVAGRVFLRDPGFIAGCPPYAELRTEARRLPLDGEVEALVAGVAHLARIERGDRDPGHSGRPERHEQPVAASADPGDVDAA